MTLKAKAHALIDLMDRYSELVDERAVMQSNTEFPFTHSEMEEVQEKIDMVLMSIQVMVNSIGNHFQE
jgi:hypothetical protein